MAAEPDDKTPEKDNLRDDIARAFESVTNDAADLADADPPPADDPPPGDDGQPREPDGKFAAKPKAARETLTLKPKGATELAAPVKSDSALPGDGQPSPAGGQPADNGAPKVPPQRVPPPVNWKGREKVQWEKLSPYLQAALKEDYERNETDYAPLRAVHESLQASRELLETEGGSIEGGVKKLLAISTWARDNPVEFVQTFIRQRGLNPAQLFGQAPPLPNGQAYAPQPQQQPPEFQALQQRIDAMESTAKRQSLTQALSAIESFANDPAHPYFADVQRDMENLLKADPSLGLQGAYERAVWGNPATRAQLQAQQSAGVTQSNAATVAAARNAKAANISGTPVPGAKSQPSGDRPDDLRAEIERNYRAAMGGQRV